MRRWTEAAAVYRDKRILVILFLGFSSGLPLLLTFSTLSIWLKELGVSKTAIGLFVLPVVLFLIGIAQFAQRQPFSVHGVYHRDVHRMRDGLSPDTAELRRRVKIFES